MKKSCRCHQEPGKQPASNTPEPTESHFDMDHFDMAEMRQKTPKLHVCSSDHEKAETAARSDVCHLPVGLVVGQGVLTGQDKGRVF